MEQQLQDIGLTELQAKTYLYLLSYATGRKPAQIATALSITRTNCYKILEQLADYDLVRKSTTTKTLTFYAEDPIALTSFVSRARNQTLQLEKNVKASMANLQKQYQKKQLHTETTTAYGKTAISQAYREQTKTTDSIYFIKSRADIPFMGYETMAAIRSRTTPLGIMRYGITPDAAEAPNNPIHDEQNNLSRTWMSQDAYTSPVEWTVSGDELAIINFTGSGSTIRIKDKIIATSFLEIWKLLDTSLRADPKYTQLPVRAERND